MSAERGLLLCGVGVQLASVALLSILPLYAAMHCGFSAAQLARTITLPRYAATALGVLLAAPLARRHGRVWLLRVSLALSALGLLLLATAGHTLMIYCSAVVSAASSVGMVAVSSLLQGVSRGDIQRQTSVNARYRLYSAVAATLYPLFAAAIQALFDEGSAMGYHIAFAVVGLMLLGVRCPDCDEGPQQAGRKEEKQVESPNGKGTPHTPLHVTVLEILKQPYRDLVQYPAVLEAVIHITILSLPSHIFGAMNTSLLLDLGASESYQAACASLANGAALLTIYYSKYLVETLTARTCFVLLNLVNGMCLAAMGLSGDLFVVSLAFVLSTVVNKATPVAMAVWLSDVSPAEGLTAAFASEKFANCVSRALWSEGLAQLVQVYSVDSLFASSGLVLIATSVFELGIDPRWSRRRSGQEHGGDRLREGRVMNGHGGVHDNVNGKHKGLGQTGVILHELAK